MWVLVPIAEWVFLRILYPQFCFYTAAVISALIIPLISAHGLALADGHSMIREHLRNLPAGVPELQVTGEVADGLALLQRMEHSGQAFAITETPLQKAEGI